MCIKYSSVNKLRYVSDCIPLSKICKSVVADAVTFYLAIFT